MSHLLWPNFIFGTVDPTLPVGILGDAYVNTNSGDLFCKYSPGWMLVGNMMGHNGAAGSDGARGSLFLGTYASTAVLPAIDGVAVRIGDFAYISGTGELWKAS